MRDAVAAQTVGDQSPGLVLQPPQPPLGELHTELPAPPADALVGHAHPAFGQDKLDITQTQAEHVVQPDCLADDLGQEPVPMIRGGL
jgi:hypothetical protein